MVGAVGERVVDHLGRVDVAGLAKRRSQEGCGRGSARDGAEHGIADAARVEDVLRLGLLHGRREVGGSVGSEAVAAAATDVHAVAVKVHLAVVWQRLGRRGGRVEGGARGRVVVGGVE